MSAILKFDFQKREQLRFFLSKLSKLHKKDPILHVATTFSQKQGETRTSHGPIPHPLSKSETICYNNQETWSGSGLALCCNNPFRLNSIWSIGQSWHYRMK